MSLLTKPRTSHEVPAPVLRYLEALERKLKSMPVVSVEDALSDAREHLIREWEAIRRADPGMNESDGIAHLEAIYGSPDEVAESCRIAGGPDQPTGNAPGWRICCRSCGRSIPAANLGIIRIGAWSNYKLILTWCSGCRQYRWVRLIQDLEDTNLTRALGLRSTSDEARKQVHQFPWRSTLMATLFLVLGLMGAAMVVVLMLFLLLGLATQTQAAQPPHPFPALPNEWKIVRNDVIAAKQREAVAKKLNLQLVDMANTVVEYRGAQIQINRLDCPSVQEAEKATKTLIQIKQNPRQVLRRDKQVYEWVVRKPEDGKLAILSRYALGIQPSVIQYRIAFDATPLKRSTDMQWNTMYNYFRQLEKGDPQIASKIAKERDQFLFDEALSLRRYGLGSQAIEWEVKPKSKPLPTTADEDGLVRFPVSTDQQRLEFPYLHVVGNIRSESMKTSPCSQSDSSRWIRSNEAWPANDKRIQDLVRSILQGNENPQQKLDKILEWTSVSGKLRYGGDVVGSRYGCLRVLEQGYGRCWDYSDVMITLCRAAGLPTRQVFGWMDLGEGHVWVEVLLENAWMQVDPTTGCPCGSDYIPLANSDDGQTPLLYLSSVMIEPR
jgi:transglutaminase-like putative cysteine protease